MTRITAPFPDVTQHQCATNGEAVIRLIACITLALLLSSAEAFCAIRRVPEQYGGIQSAIDAAVDGDTVLVNDGTYFEHVSFKGKAITVTTVNGAATTILAVGVYTNLVDFTAGEGRGSVFSGFTLLHGKTAVYMYNASPTISDNIFDGNQSGAYYFTTSIEGHGSSPDIQRNLFRNIDCPLVFFGVESIMSFWGTSSPRIASNVIANNPCRGLNMFLSPESQPLVVNNSFVHNYVGITIDAHQSTVQQKYVNNILSDNMTGLEVTGLVLGNEPTWRRNQVTYGGYYGIPPQTGINGNIDNEPGLILDEWGFPPFPFTSPVVDSADADAIAFADKDFTGRPRVQDGDGDCVAHVDFGATEAHPVQVAEIVPATLNFGSVPVNTSTAPVGAALTNTGLGCLSIHGMEVNGQFSVGSGCSPQLPKGASCMLQITFSPTVAGSALATVSVDSNSMYNPQVATLTGLGVDFNVTAATSSVSVTAGAPAQYHIAIVQQYAAYALPIGLTCSDLPPLSSCQFSPATVNASADANSGGSTLTIMTTAPSSASRTNHRRTTYLALLLAPLFGIVVVGRGRRTTLLLSLLALSVLLLSCGGTSSNGTVNPPVGGTPSGTYTITVTGSSSASTHTAAVSLTIR